MEAQEGAVQEGTTVLLAERLQMRGAPFFPLPPVEGEKRRISEACAKVDSYMLEKHRTSVPDLHQVAEAGSWSRGGHDQLGSGRGRPGSGRGRPGSGRGRPGSGRGRPGSGCGRPGSGHGLHTPGGGNVKIFSAQLPDFSHIQSRVDSSPPTPTESAQSLRKSIGCSAELAKGTPLGSSHSKFKDHFHSKDSATSLLRNSGPGEVTSALTRRNKSTSGLTGRNKRSTGGERLLGTHNGGRECSSEGRRKHSSERLDGRPGLPTPPRGGVPLTHSDTTVVQELNAIRRHAQPKVDAGNPVPTFKDIFCSVAELTDRESFNVNVRFLLRPQLVAAIFKRRRSFSEIDASATLDRRKARGVDCFSLKRSKSLNDLYATISVPAEGSLAPDRASTLPRTWQPQGREGEGHIPSFFCGKVLPHEKCVEGSEGTDHEKDGVDCAERKTGGSHTWGCHGDEAGSYLHHSPGAGRPQATSGSDRGRSVLTTPIKKTKADTSAVNCKRSPHQLKMALPLSLRRYT